MKRLSFFFALVFSICLAAASASAQQHISVDNVSNDAGPLQLEAGNVHVISIRINNLGGPAAKNYNPNNGFAISSPDSATWDSTYGTNNVAGNINTGAPSFFTQFFINRRHFPGPLTQGTNADSIAFAGVSFDPTKGLSTSYNGIAYQIIINSKLSDTGKHICIDSAAGTAPIGTWTWAGLSTPNVKPTWQGKTCYEIFKSPNFPPTISNCPVSITGSHCATLTYDFNATDVESDGFLYQLVSGPGSINTTTGVWSWNGATLLDVGASITLVVDADDAGDGPNCTVNIIVTNAGPSITACPAGALTITTGDTKTQNVDASDDCDPLTWTVTALTPGTTGAFSVDATGLLSYTPSATDGPAVRCFAVVASDGLASDTCNVCYNVITGAPYGLTIEDVACQIQGGFVTVDLTLESIDPQQGLGGFDLLIAYDNSALSPQSALPGAIYTECGWEYFTYRFGANGICSGGCPSGLMRLVGIAETNNGANHPGCASPTPFVGTLPVTLAHVVFLISNNRTLECQYVPIRWFWVDCTDNTLSNASGSQLYVSDKVFESGNSNPVNNGTGTFPTYLGAQNSCLVPGPKGTPIRNIDFQNGGVCIICADSIDARGDINLNGVYIEIADVVMFTNYFVNGLGAFAGHVDGSIAASDVNADGNPLTVADLVYAIKVVVGDFQAVPKVSAQSGKYNYTNGTFSVDGELGGAFVVVKGNVTPELLINEVGTVMTSSFDGQNTRILVIPDVNHFGFGVNSFSGDVLDLNNAQIVSVELADATGNMVAAKTIPSSYSLNQNYPNPFNPKTTISFGLPKAGDYTLTIYNVTGQVVNEFNGSSDAGTVTYEWDASNNASGVYFYKLDVKGQVSLTKKAVLLK